MTIAENVFIGREPRALGLVDWPRDGAAPRRSPPTVGLDHRPAPLVSDLSVAEQQMVEIAEALSMDAELVVMDEPTSALTDHEVAAAVHASSATCEARSSPSSSSPTGWTR